MKKIISIILTAAIMMLGAVPAMAADTGEPSAWAKEDVQNAITRGLVPIRLQSNYQAPITREEFAELLVTAVFTDAGKHHGKTDPEFKKYWEQDSLTLDYFLSKISTTTSFEDTDSKYVKAANILGIANGISSTQFNPSGLITREQAAIMFMNYLQTVCYSNTAEAEREVEDIGEVSPWAKEAVARAYSARFIRGTRELIYNQQETEIIQRTLFEPKGNITREQAIVIVYRAAQDNYLRYLIIRGYIRIDMDMLGFGLEIDNDKVCLKDGSYTNEYSNGRNLFYSYEALYKYYNQVDTREATAWLFGGSGYSIYDTNYIESVLSNQPTEFDYAIYTIKHFTDGYLAIAEKREGMGYYSVGAALLRYGYNNEYIAECVQRK